LHSSVCSGSVVSIVIFSQFGSLHEIITVVLV
jgi:hypothetical protein